MAVDRISNLGLGQRIAMKRRMIRRVAAAAAICCAFPVGTMAATPDVIDQPSAASVPVEYQLDTEMVVDNWVLCVSEQLAESIARAREDSVAAARKIYSDLASAKSCGRFAKLAVKLRQPLFRSAPGLDHDSRVFSALVNIGGAWQTAFVVKDDMPAE
jgi:hypothetical protein